MSSIALGNRLALKNTSGKSLPKQGLVQHLNAVGNNYMEDKIGESNRPVQPGRCYRFSGTPVEGIDVGSIPATDGFTVSIYFIWEGDITGPSIQNFITGTNAAWYPGIGKSTKKVRWYNGAGWVWGSITINAGTLYHIILRFDKNNSKLTTFIDGVKDIDTTTIYTDGTIRGISKFNTREFVGIMYDIKIYDHYIDDAGCIDLYNNVYTSTIPNRHFKCEEGAGTTSFDSSGNGNHGTIVNATLSTFHTTNYYKKSYLNEEGYNIGLYKDSGTGWDTYSYFNIPLFSDGYIEYTVNTSPITNDVHFGFTKDPDNTSHSSFAYSIMCADSGNIVKYEGTSSTTIGTWSIGDVIKIELAGNTVNYYKNNVLLSSSSIVTDFPYYFSVHIADIGYTSGFKVSWGTIYEYINSSNVSMLYIPKDDYSLSKDIFNHDLQFTERVKYSPKLVDSFAATFDGVDDYGEFSQPIVPDFTQPFSVSVWVKFNITTNNSESIIEGFGNGRFALTLGYASGPLKLGYVINSDTWKYDITFNGVTLEDGNFHHIVFVYDGSNVNLYVDTVKNNPPLTGGFYALYNRLAYSNYSALASTLTDVRVFTSALSIDEIAYIYSNGSYGSQPPNPYGHWPISEGRGTTLHDISGSNNVTVYNASESTLWGTTQDVIHHNIVNGFSLYTHSTNPPLRIPYKLDGTPISGVVPTGYSLGGERPSVDGHNEAETGLKMDGVDGNLSNGTFWLNSSGVLKTRYWADIVEDWNNEQITFADVSKSGKKINIVTYKDQQVEPQLSRIKKFLNH